MWSHFGLVNEVVQNIERMDIGIGFLYFFPKKNIKYVRKILV